MFEFLKDANNYEERVVGRWDDEDRRTGVSTAFVSDGISPYETAIWHPDYNGGGAIIVEAYDTKNAAETGHAKWAAIVQSGDLPDPIKDCHNAKVAQMILMLSGRKLCYRRKRG